MRSFFRAKRQAQESKQLTRRAYAPRKHALLLVAMGTLAGLFIIELSVRVATRSVFTWRGKESQSNFITDPLIGRIPRPGVSVRHPNGFSFNIGDYGTRRNGNDPPVERPLTLAVGDSFAFGDGVNDEDSWPAVLEQLLGSRVINAAVPGFGLDQAVLRAEQLAEVYTPDTIVVSFIPHDVLRCEMSYWSGHAKPYFDIDSSRLRLHAAPVPPRRAVVELKRLLSWSATLNVFFPKFYWEGPEAMVVHRQGREVSCLLMQRLAALAGARRARIVVLAQPQQASAEPEHLEITSGVLACAQANRLLTLDLLPVIQSLPGEQRERLFPRHMNAEGNRLVARELAGFLGRYTPTPGRVP